MAFRIDPTFHDADDHLKRLAERGNTQAGLDLRRMQSMLAERADTIDRLRHAVATLTARAEAAERDAARYRAIREASSAIKLYVYEDPADPFSGDWLYKPKPEDVDRFADAALSAEAKGE